MQHQLALWIKAKKAGKFIAQLPVKVTDKIEANNGMNQS